MATSLASGAREEARGQIALRMAKVRADTQALAAPLTPEDQQAQSMADTSPTKWHLAHTTWFFETFILSPYVPSFAPFDASFGYLFNSYYEAVGPRHPRPARGLLTRPSLASVLAWRERTDEALQRFIGTASEDAFQRAAPMIELGLNHEEQHQELILMDALHLFSLNPLEPAYASAASGTEMKDAGTASRERSDWTTFEGGLTEIGHSGNIFAFDNEGPRHKVWIEDYRLANRLVTNGQFREFIEAGGYDDPLLWLADGWDWVRSEAVRHPLYWREQDGEWGEFTLRGLLPLDAARPVAHLSLYEADAYARFRGTRLPTEAEWENAAQRTAARSRPCNLLGGRAFMALHAGDGDGMGQMVGDLWEWTQSAYGPYPGFVPAAGAVGEYNGKFMSGQMVLRGGSFATPDAHIRSTYRNFFYPRQRWMFSGLRLAGDEA